MSGVACGGSAAALSPAPERQRAATNTIFNCKPSGDDRAGRSPAEPIKPSRVPSGDALASAGKILRAFNTWAFKREQPSDAELMLRTIAEAVAAAEPVPFVLYWGKGPRCDAGAHEVQCLDFLGALAARIAAVYAPGAALTLILTDTHAEHNGHSREHIRQYFDDVKMAAERRGFATCWLGHLVKAAGMLGTAAPLDAAVSQDMLGRLMASAQKWYQGPGTTEEGALTYLRMNLIEQRVVERAFPRSIFVTFNGSELRGLFPRHMPIFYMYSLRRGVAVKPWFLPAQSIRPESEDDRAPTPHPDAA